MSCLISLPCHCLTGKFHLRFWFSRALHILISPCHPKLELVPSHQSCPTLIPLTLALHYQLPTTNYQLPTTNYQLPTTNYQLSNFEELEWRLKLSSSLLNNFSIYIDIGLQNCFSWIKSLKRKSSICFTITRLMSLRTLFIPISQIGTFLLHERDDDRSIVSVTSSQFVLELQVLLPAPPSITPIAIVPTYTIMLNAITTTFTSEILLHDLTRKV